MDADLVAKDVMRTDFQTVSEAADVWEMARLFTTHGIAGAPVVSEAGKLLGVVSLTDIIRHLKEVFESCAQGRAFYSESEPDSPKRPARAVTAGALMTMPAIHAEEDTPVIRLSVLMATHRIHRIIITRQGRVRGIVATMDLLKAI